MDGNKITDGRWTVTDGRWTVMSTKWTVKDGNGVFSMEGNDNLLFLHYELRIMYIIGRMRRLWVAGGMFPHSGQYLVMEGPENTDRRLCFN